MDVERVWSYVMEFKFLVNIELRKKFYYIRRLRKVVSYVD